MSKTNNRIIEIFGWFGVGLILLSYALNSTNIIGANQPIYILMNLFGAIAVAVDAYKDRNTQPIVLNLIWAVIALINLIS